MRSRLVKSRGLRVHGLVFALLFLTGCGFHLRGMTDIPEWLTNVAIIVQQGHADLATLLKERLKAYHIAICDEPNRATYWLIILHDNFAEHIMSVSSSTTPRQYQLVYTVQFKLQSRQSGEIIPTTQIAVTRQLTINSDRILGSNDEEERFKNEMRREAIVQILDRISHKALLIPQPKLVANKNLSTQSSHHHAP